MQAPRPPLPLGRILFAGMMVPALFVWMNLKLLQGLQHGSVSLPFVFGVYVAEVGALGLLAGGLIPNLVLRWFIYGWTWALLDLHVIVSTLEVPRPEVMLLADSLFAAQIGLLTVWAILGTSPSWVIRWPLALVLVAACFPLITVSNWARCLIQIVALTALCGVLAWQQFRLFRLRDEADVQTPAASMPLNLRMQFGVRHVLIWTTTVAVMLAILKALNLLSMNTVRILQSAGAIEAATNGGFAAIVLIIALWAGLGRGPAWLRWPLPIAVPFLGGAAVGFIDWITRSPYGRIPGPRYPASAWHQFWRFELPQIIWLCLASTLLFAGLLYFRAQGVRLGRKVELKDAKAV